jgi:hypothetical protein
MAPIALTSLSAADHVSAVVAEALERFWSAIASIPSSIIVWPINVAKDVGSTVSTLFQGVATWISSSFAGLAEKARPVMDIVSKYAHVASAWISSNAPHIAIAVSAACHSHPKLVGLTLLGIFEPTIILTGFVVVFGILYLAASLAISLLLSIIGFGIGGVRGGMSLLSHLGGMRFTKSCRRFARGWFSECDIRLDGRRSRGLYVLRVAKCRRAGTYSSEPVHGGNDGTSP